MTSRPRKHWYRLRNILLAFLAVFAIAAGWLGIEVYRAFTAVPGPIADYAGQYEDLMARYQADVADDPNAWPTLTEAVSLSEKALRPDGVSWIDYQGEDVAIDVRVLIGAELEGDVVQVSSPEPQSRAVAEAALTRAEASGLYDRLAALATMRHAVRPPQEGPVIGWRLPELGALRRIATINAIRMCRAHEAGDDTAIVAPFEQGLAIAHHLANQATSLDHVVACNIAESTAHELRCELQDRSVSPPVMRQLLEAMDRQLPLPPAEIAVEGDRLMALDMIDRVHTASGRVIIPAFVELNADPLFGPAEPPGPLSNLGSIWLARKPETVRLCNEFYDVAAAISRLRRAEQLLASRLSEIYSLTESDPKKYIVLGSVLIAPGKRASDRGIAEVNIAGTRLMLAIELFRAARGALPERLDDLVPEFLLELPQDQWASDGFRYRVADRGYLLYSVGADLKDDDGQPHPDNPRRAFHPTGAGFDYVLNQPRRPLAEQLVFPDP